MLYTHFTQEILGFQEIIIAKVESNENELTIYAELERKKHNCISCGTATDTIHDYRKQTIKDIPAFGKLIRIVLRKRRYRCPHCGKRFFESNSFLPKYHRMTNRLSAFVINKLTDERSFTIIIVAKGTKIVGIYAFHNCYVLFLNRDSEKIDTLLIPIKIIITKNEELKNKITKATNNQTSITKEQLEALSSYQKDLEEYYKTFKDDERLYYERRSGQYRNEAVEKKRIVSIRTQIKNASAMFNEKPHDAAGHYSSLVKDIGVRLFKVDDKPSLYYTASLALFRFDNLIKSKAIDKKYSKGKYHIIMLLKYMFGDVPKFHNAKKNDAFCAKIQKVLNDPEKCLTYFTKIVEYIDEQGLDLSDRKLFERKDTTETLLKNISQLKNKT